VLPANRAFDALLKKRGFQDTTRGGHDWNQVIGWLPDLFQILFQHLPAKG
jgi:hypothetical protein